MLTLIFVCTCHQWTHYNKPGYITTNHHLRLKQICTSNPELANTAYTWVKTIVT